MEDEIQSLSDCKKLRAENQTVIRIVKTAMKNQAILGYNIAETSSVVKAALDVFDDRQDTVGSGIHRKTLYVLSQHDRAKYHCNLARQCAGESTRWLSGRYERKFRSISRM
ncbi:hypothetical protein TNCV_4190991 [Trichonephila clavipes]|nr:hypothetical protein TNCV_4190991 [Trichonephila clavipes]